MYVIPWNFLGDCRFSMVQLLSLTKWIFHPNSIIHDNISSQVVEKRRHGFGQWMSSSIIHDNIYSLLYKKWHPKSYHSHIKYYMTLNIIFSAVSSNLHFHPLLAYSGSFQMTCICNKGLLISRFIYLCM